MRRAAWLVVAHSSFDLAEYAQAELAYTRVLEATPQEDESRAALVENLAASIYKQGEQANAVGEYRTAADHFLRIKQAAPTSKALGGWPRPDRARSGLILPASSPQAGKGSGRRYK